MSDRDLSLEAMYQSILDGDDELAERLAGDALAPPRPSSRSPASAAAAASSTPPPPTWRTAQPDPPPAPPWWPVTSAPPASCCRRWATPASSCSGVTAGGVVYDDASPAAFARDLVTMVDAGARVVGGCCGTDPEFIRRARQALDRRPADPRRAVAT